LPTRLVSLVGPDDQGRVMMPAKGEKLQLADIGELTNDPLARAALKRVAEDKAPPSVAQLVVWNLVNGFDWSTIGQYSRTWANAHEMALARDFVARLPDSRNQKYGEVEAGTIYWDLTSRRGEKDAFTAELRKLLEGQTVIGLTAKSGIPTAPKGPAITCRIRLEDESAHVQVSSSDEAVKSWVPVGKFQVGVRNSSGAARKPIEVVDAFAESLLGRLTSVKLIEGPKQNGKRTYKIRVDNASPLILNALALAGTDSKDAPPASLAGFSIPPHKSLTLPATAELVKRLGLTNGIKLLGADLSSL
jgi:hypothetical protein